MTARKNLSKLAHILCATTALTFAASSAFAQDIGPETQAEAEASVEADVQAEMRTPPRQLEEIIVTAQKREQAIQNVPISMTAISGEALHEQGVTDVREALQLVPNASVDAAGFFAAPRVRGFTLNNNNKSFEPPVGMVLDNIPHTRIPYFVAALFDISRMEVLRGPQGTSFGKNTTAGLIHLVSHQPSDEWDATGTLEAGELNRYRVEAAVGGPITNGINFRIAGLYDTRDGYIENTTARTNPSAPEELKDRERIGVRATVQFTDLWDSTLTIGYEHFDLYDGGAALEIITAGPVMRDTLRRYDPNTDFEPGNWVASQDYPDFRDVAIDRYRVQWDKTFSFMNLVAIAAYSNMEQTLALDTDFTPAEAIIGTGSDESPEWYGEVRFIPNTLNGLFGLNFMPGETDFLFGVNGGRREINDSHFTFGVNNTPFWDMTVAGLVDAQGVDVPLALSELGLPINPGEVPSKLDEMDQFFNQQSDELSIFAHVQYQFLPDWGIELGGRYTTEKKSADWDVFFTTPEPNTALRAIGVEPFTATRELDQSNFQPKVSLNWAPVDNIMIFAHWERGYKGGGFNAFAMREGTNPVTDSGFEDDDLTFQDEVATNIGLDFKSRLFNNTMYLNVSLFHQTAEDFQVLIRENPPATVGLGTSRVINAEEAVSRGVEADLQWLATEWLTIGGSLGILDTEFVEFSDGECAAGTSNANTDGDDNPRCDQSGKSFPFAPEVGATLSLRGRFPLQPIARSWEWLRDVELTIGTLVEYESSQLLDVDLDERKRQDAYTRFKADIGVGSLEDGWALRVIGENLTNTETHVRLGDVVENVIIGSQNQPRLIYVQFRKDF